MTSRDERHHTQQRALYELAMSYVLKARTLLVYAKLRSERHERERRAHLRAVK
jgi:hypothetical protein